MTPPAPLIPARPSYVIDVSRPTPPRSWKAGILAPFELLTVAWTVPLLVLLLMLLFGLAAAAAVWLVRLIF